MQADFPYERPTAGKALDKTMILQHGEGAPTDDARKPEGLVKLPLGEQLVSGGNSPQTMRSCNWLYRLRYMVPLSGIYPRVSKQDT